MFQATIRRGPAIYRVAERKVNLVLSRQDRAAPGADASCPDKIGIGEAVRVDRLCVSRAPGRGELVMVADVSRFSKRLHEFGTAGRTGEKDRVGWLLTERARAESSSPRDADADGSLDAQFFATARDRFLRRAPSI